MKRFYPLILLTSLLSCQEQPKQKPDFLIGDWTRLNNKQGEQTYEMWKEDFTGLGFTLTSQDTTFKEVLSIISIKDTLYLQVEGVNEKPTLFKFIEQTDSSFTCVNPKNEFPKKITYFKDHNQLKAIVANDDFQLDFVFSKKLTKQTNYAHLMKSLKQLLLIFSAWLLGMNLTNGQNGHQIEFEIKNYDGNKITLAYHFGQKQYIKSELTRQESGRFVASGKEALEPGMYIVVLSPSKTTFDFLVNKNEQHFKLSTDQQDLIANMKVEGSPENTRFFKYLNYLSKQRKLSNQLNEEIKRLQKSTVANKTQKQAEKKQELEKLGASVNAYQNAIIDMAPDSFTSKIIKAQLPIQIPADIKNDNKKAFAYYRDHFFDNIDFSDERMIRTSLIGQMIKTFYSDQITGGNPKITIENVDRVLKLAEVNKELYKFSLVQSVNSFAKSKSPCMAGVYVHIVDNYYSKGKASWLKNETLENMKSSANALRSSICGKKAPNLKLKDLGFPEAQSNLHDVKAKLTVLLFWDPDDPLNSENIPKLVKHYKTRVNKKHLKVYTVCAANREKMGLTDAFKKCNKQVKDYKMESFFNCIDLNNDSKFRSKYNLKKTPVIYLLDADKTILRDRLSVEQFIKLK